MKKLRFVASSLFTVCILSVPAIAQTKSWTYQANNGAERGDLRQEITIIITQKRNGYEVTGEYKNGWNEVCPIRGQYFPNTKHFRGRAICGGDDVQQTIEGIRVEADQLQINEPWRANAWRDGIERKKTESALSLGGTWHCDDGGTYVITQTGESISWEAKSADEGKTFSHTFVGKIEGNLITGHFTDHPPGSVRQEGDLEFKIISKNQLTRQKATVPFGCSVMNRKN